MGVRRVYGVQCAHLSVHCLCQAAQCFRCGWSAGALRVFVPADIPGQLQVSAVKILIEKRLCGAFFDGCPAGNTQ